jgi:hypothetical protein
MPPFDNRSRFEQLDNSDLHHPTRRQLLKGLTGLGAAMLCNVPILSKSATIPSITETSGSSAHNGSLTLTGSGFGAKTIAGPMLYDDFDTGVINSSVETRAPLIHQGSLASYNLWQKDGGGSYSDQVIRLNNSSPKVRSSLHARAIFNNSAFWGLNLFVPYTGFTTGNELFISFYYRMTRTGASYGRQSKAWIAYDNSWADRAYWSTAYNGCEGGGWRQHRTDIDDRSFPLEGNQIDKEWVRFEHYLKQSSPGGSNGMWRTTVHRPSLGSPVIISQSLANVPLRTSATEWTRWVFGGAYYSMCSASDFATLDVDDFYFDNTQARVELGNASTLALCTSRELQRATAWANDRITITVNRGYLGDRTTVYAYVYDATGTANAVGFPVSGSETGEGTPPAPTNLTVT